MSDLGRQDVTDKIESAVKPDSQKSTIEKAGDSLTGTGDSIASKLEPESEKSTTQQASDNTSSAVESAQQILSDAADAASVQIKKTADYLSGATSTEATKTTETKST